MSICLSVRFCGHSSLVIFSYDFFQISNMDCFHQTLVPVRIWVLSDELYLGWPTKWPPPVSLPLRTLYRSHLLPDCFQISYMDYFYQNLDQVRIWVLSDNQDGLKKWLPPVSSLLWTLYNLIIYHPISSKFHIMNSWPKYGNIKKRRKNDQTGTQATQSYKRYLILVDISLIYKV